MQGQAAGGEQCSALCHGLPGTLAGPTRGTLELPDLKLQLC